MSDKKQFVFLANTLFSLKRVSNKVTQLDHFSSVILFSHCCHLFIPILTLVILTMSLWVVTGHFDVVASDVAEIMRIGAEMGLSLNVSKCELTAHSNLQLNDSLLQSFSRVDIADTTLLGAPLFYGPVLDSTWNQRCDDLSRAVELRLSSIASQDALILLRASFSAPKVLHL